MVFRLVKRTRIALLIIQVVCFGACEPENPADLVLVNGNVLTVDQENSVAEAIAITDGRISVVGSTRAVLKHAGHDTTKVDLDGKTVIPGIVDAHTHLRGIAANVGKLNITEASSVVEVLDTISRYANTLPAGTWIETATGWQPTNFSENRMPSREELDAVAPDHPVFLKKGYQNGVVNSMALEVAGVTSDNASQSFLRDMNNKLTGEIYGSLDEITDAQPAPNERQTEQTYVDAMQLVNGYGVTSLRDAALAPAQVALLRKLTDEGRATVRVNAVGQIYPPTPLQVDKRMWEHVPISRDDWFTHDTLKIIADGGITDALLRDDYAWTETGGAGYRGRFVTQMGKIKDVANWACESGRKLAVHTIGDAMIDALLDHYEAIHDDCAVGPLGWTIEHVALVTPEQADRIKALDIAVTTQSGLNYSLAAAWRKHWGEGRMARSVPNRMLIDKGILPGGGTDANTGPVNSFVAIWSDVTRQTRDGVIGEEQAVTPLESLRMHTVWAANVLGSQNDVGSIEPGKFADLAVLDRDILSIADDAIKDTQVVLTFVNGQKVFERGQ
jgi:predicted amidohydrolase YtcJ